MDDLKEVHSISEEEIRLLALKNKIKWFTIVMVIAAIAIAGMLFVDFYPELLRRLLGTQERGDLSKSTSSYTLSTISGIVSNSTAYLGIEIQEIDKIMAQAMSLRSEKGVVVTHVFPSSPADLNGLLPGDIVLRFDRKIVKDTSDIQDQLKEIAPGDVIKIVIDRDGQTRTFYIELGSTPAVQKASLIQTDTTINNTINETTQWGCTLAPLTQELAQTLSIPASIKGVVVVTVSASGLAKAAGILPGDVITKINRQSTETLQTFYQRIENQSVVVLEIFRNNRLIYIQLQIENAIAPAATIAGSIPDAPALQKRIAIASMGNDLNAMMSSYFGSAPFYIIVDMDTKQFSVVPNNSMVGSGSYGMGSIQLILDQGAEAIIAENYGPQVYQALMAARIVLYRANPGKISDIIQQYETYMLSQVTSPTTQGMSRNLISTGGSPFTTDDSTDDDEEQSGYKGMPYTIPPQGKYDPALDPANTSIQNTAGSTLTLNQQTQCYCPICNVVYSHPLKVPCSSLSCDICGNRLINLNSGLKPSTTLTAGTILTSDTNIQTRVAVASQGTDMNATMAPLFGTAPYFIIIDIKTNQYKVVQNPASSDTRSFGVIASQLLTTQNIGAVIAGAFGPRAYAALTALNIIPYTAQLNTIVNVINDYRSGKLSPSTDATLPGFGYALNVIPTGGAPFSSDDEEDDEEQSGYKGLPYSIPPKGKYDPDLDPTKNTDSENSIASPNIKIPQRVAVAATGNNLTVLIAPVFRTAPYFIIFDINTNQYSVVYNTYLTNSTLSPAQIIASYGVGATIAGSYGPICYNSLIAYNIIPYTANPGKIADIIEQYKTGALPQIQPLTQTQIQTPTQTQLQIIPNMMPTGGSPFTSTDDDEEEEQSGYKGMPYTIPPQGKYDPLLDSSNIATNTGTQNFASNTVANTVAGTTQRTDYCYCPYCRILVPHPSAVSCSALACPLCNNRLMNWDVSGGSYQNTLTVVPSQIPITQQIAGVLSAGTSTNYIQIPSFSQTPVSNAILQYPQTTYIQVPTLSQNQLRTGSTTQNTSNAETLNLNQQNQYCYCPHCNVIYEHSAGVPCSSMICTACGNRLISLNGAANNLLTKTSQMYVSVIAGQPTTIPAGQTSAGVVVSNQPNTIPPMGQTSAGIAVSSQPSTIPPMGQTSAGIAVSNQPTTIPMGQTSAGIAVSNQPTTIPMGQTSAGIAVSNQPTTIPPMGQTSAGVVVAGQPTTTLQMSVPTAGIATSGPPDTMPPMGQTTAGIAPDSGAMQGTLDGNCICPICGTTVPHERGTACYTIPCPKCSTLMVKEGAILNRTALIAGTPSMGQLSTAITIAGVPTNIPAGSAITQQQTLQTTAGIQTAQTIAGNSTTNNVLQGTIDGNCLCPLCGTTVPHIKGTACYTIPCPKCSTLMVNEGATFNQLSPQLLKTASVAAGTYIPNQTTMTIAQQIAGSSVAGSQIAGIIDLPAMTIANTAIGNICIASTGASIESQVSDIFDKARYFLIVGLGAIKAIPNPNVKDLLGSGIQSAQLIVSEGAKVLITNDIGIKALEELNTLNVQVYTGVKGTASQALSWYQDGRLTATTLNTAINTIEEEHGPPSSSKAKAKGETSTKTL
nr:magnetosome protein MamT-greigite [Desulfobacteraceae bacterium]